MALSNTWERKPQDVPRNCFRPALAWDTSGNLPHQIKFSKKPYKVI